jgi:heme-degrading monooxygenase HmoA
MFARNVTMQLRPNCVEEFSRTMETEVIPLLKKQKGFKDELSFVVANGTEAVGISLWETKESAEAYNRETYPKIVKNLAEVIQGTPTVKTYEVTNSTIHNLPGCQAG